MRVHCRPAAFTEQHSAARRRSFRGRTPCSRASRCQPTRSVASGSAMACLCPRVSARPRGPRPAGSSVGSEITEHAASGPALGPRPADHSRPGRGSTARSSGEHARADHHRPAVDRRGSPVHHRPPDETNAGKHLSGCGPRRACRASRALVPAHMQLLGPRNWWAPRPLTRHHNRLDPSSATSATELSSRLANRCCYEQPDVWRRLFKCSLWTLERGFGGLVDLGSRTWGTWSASLGDESRRCPCSTGL